MAGGRPGRRKWIDHRILVEPDYLIFCLKNLSKAHRLITMGEASKLLGMTPIQFSKFARGEKLEPEKDPVQLHQERGHMPANRSAKYYDPRVIAASFSRMLSKRGDDRGAEVVFIEDEGFEVHPPVREHRERKNSWQYRFDVEKKITEAEDFGQWLTPTEVVAWLGVSKQTLYLWRIEFDKTKDRKKFPPYNRGKDYVPSSARTDGVVHSGALKSKRGPHYTVLYDRNQLIVWLKGLQVEEDPV